MRYFVTPLQISPTKTYLGSLHNERDVLWNIFGHAAIRYALMGLDMVILPCTNCLPPPPQACQSPKATKFAHPGQCLAASG